MGSTWLTVFILVQGGPADGWMRSPLVFMNNDVDKPEEIKVLLKDQELDSTDITAAAMVT